MNRKIGHRICMCFITGFLILFSGAGSYTQTRDDIGKKIVEYLNAQKEVNQFSGSVLVAHKGTVIISKGYGLANHEHEIPNSPETRFRIASLTKQFTAMAIMILEEDGTLRLDDQLSTYIPDYPRGEEITIVHLLTHTSGIPNHTELPGFNRERRVYECDIEKTIAAFKNKELEFTPGEKFAYSNSGYILLGYIIEKVTGASYGDFIKERIFKPLKMGHSGFEYTEMIIKKRAYGYTREGNEYKKAAYRIMSNAHASGALYSTTEDLYLWDRALYTEALVSKESLDKMFTPYTKQYGYGWGIVNLFNRKMAGHNGEIEGYRTNMSRFVDDYACIIILSNCEQTPIGKMSMDLAAILFGEEYSKPKKKSVVKVEAGVLEEYTGTYELSPDFTFVITRDNTRLFCRATGQPKLEIFPESETTFFLKQVEAQIRFVRDEKNRVEKLILHQGGRDMGAVKVEQE